MVHFQTDQLSSDHQYHMYVASTNIFWKINNKLQNQFNKCAQYLVLIKLYQPSLQPTLKILHIAILSSHTHSVNHFSTLMTQSCTHSCWMPSLQDIELGITKQIDADWIMTTDYLSFGKQCQSMTDYWHSTTTQSQHQIQFMKNK